MCGHCHGGPGCYEGDYCYPGYHSPRRYYYDEELGVKERREYLEDEKRALERRLKDIDARIAEATQ